MGNIFVIEARRVADTPGLIIKEGKALWKQYYSKTGRNIKSLTY